MAAMKRELEVANARAAEQQAAAMVDAAFAKVIDTSELQLPTVRLAGEAERLACGHLYNLLCQWSSAGAYVAFTVADLRQYDQCGPALVALLQRLLGPVWALALGASAKDPAAVVPRQLALLALAGLEKLKEESKQAEEIRSAAAHSFALLTENHKKRKASR